MKKRGEYDVWYIENWSFPDRGRDGLDMRIIGMTVVQMFRGDPKAY